MVTSKTQPPDHLSDTARAWWHEVIEAYELEPHHTHLLRLACEALDRGAEARRILDDEGLVYADRFGAPRKHPAVSIEEQARVQFLRCVRELDLEGEVHPGYRRRKR